MTLSPLPPQLPPLREELELLPGPPLADGQPSWTLHDPSRNQFFQIDWPSMEMLSRWPLGSPEALLASTEQETTLRLDGTDLLNLLASVAHYEISAGTQIGAGQSVGLSERQRVEIQHQPSRFGEGAVSCHLVLGLRAF